MNSSSRLLRAVLALATAATLSAQTTKPEVLARMDATKAPYEELALKIWNYAELGYQEKQSSAALQAALKQAGFSIEAGVAGMPTAFVATFGRGAPIIGVMGEFDALPGVSQTADPVRTERPDVKAGHACGHHLFGAGSVEAVVAIKQWLQATGQPGRNSASRAWPPTPPPPPSAAAPPSMGSRRWTTW